MGPPSRDRRCLSDQLACRASLAAVISAGVGSAIRVLSTGALLNQDMLEYSFEEVTKIVAEMLGLLSALGSNIVSSCELLSERGNRDHQLRVFVPELGV